MVAAMTTGELLQVAAVAVAAFFGAVAVGRPLLRFWRLRAPCEVHFTVVPLQQMRLDYVVQDDVGHHLKEIVLPANKQVEIEIEYVPKMMFEETRISFGCDGDDLEKPEPPK
jgi:hypothetical protein